MVTWWRVGSCVCQHFVYVVLAPNGNELCRCQNSNSDSNSNPSPNPIAVHPRSVTFYDANVLGPKFRCRHRLLVLLTLVDPTANRNAACHRADRSDTQIQIHSGMSTVGKKHNVQVEKVNSVAHGTCWVEVSTPPVLGPPSFSHCPIRVRLPPSTQSWWSSPFDIRHLAPLEPSDANQGSMGSTLTERTERASVRAHSGTEVAQNCTLNS